MELNWVSRVVLSNDYNDVSLFEKIIPGICEEEAQSWLKMNKIVYFCIIEPFFICSSLNFHKSFTSSLSIDKTAQVTQSSPF